MKSSTRNNLKRPRAQSRRVTRRPLLVETLEERTLLSVSVVAGQLRIVEGSKADTVTVRVNGPTTAVIENGRMTTVPTANVASVYINAGGGNDRVDLAGIPFPVTAYLGSGNDTYIGGEAVDKVYGGNGKDWLEGRGGRDALYGEGDVDILTGGPGADYLYGGSPGAVDTIYASAWDTVYNPKCQDRVLLDTTDPGPVVNVTRIDRDLEDGTGNWLSQGTRVRAELVAPADASGRPVVNVWISDNTGEYSYGEHRFGAPRWVIRVPSDADALIPQGVFDAFAASGRQIVLQRI